MLNTTLVNLTDEYHAITRPAVYQVVRQLITKAGLDADTKIVFSGASEEVKRKGSGYREIDDGNISTAALQRIVVVAQEQDIEGDVLRSGEIYRPSKANVGVPILYDPDTEMKLEYVRTSKLVNLSLNLITENKQAAHVFRENIRLLNASNLNGEFYGAEYLPILPPSILQAMYEVYGRTVSDLTDKPDYLHWLKCRGGNIDLSNKIGGDEFDVIHKEKNIGIIGIYNVEASPEIERGEVGDTWQTSITLSFKYSKPTSFMFTCPLFVNNRFLPREFVPPMPVDHVRGMPARDYQRSQEFFTETKKIKWQGHRAMYTPIVWPWFDNWEPNVIPRSGCVVFSVHCTVDSNEPNILASLEALGNIVIQDKYLKFIRDNRDLVTRYSMSPVSIAVYKNGNICGDDEVTITEDLMVTYNKPLDPKSIWRVVMTIYSDLTNVAEVGIRALCEDGEFAQEILLGIDPTLKEKGLLPPVNANGVMSTPALLDVSRKISADNTRRTKSNNGIFYIMSAAHIVFKGN